MKRLSGIKNSIKIVLVNTYGYKMQILKTLFAFVMLTNAVQVIAQDSNNDITTVRFFTGAATIITKGLSTFPNLTLGKPAVLFDFSMVGEKIRFEPTMYFALEELKPWSFIIWFRYEAMKTQTSCFLGYILVF